MRVATESGRVAFRFVARAGRVGQFIDTGQLIFCFSSPVILRKMMFMITQSLVGYVMNLIDTLRFRINVVPCLLILEGFSHHHAPYSDHHDYYFEPFLNH